MSKLASEARAFTDSAVLDIFRELDLASSPEDFLASADAIAANPKNQLALPVRLGVPDTLDGKGTRSVDIDNAPMVHEYLGELKLADAADARLWNFLALGTYRSYMEERWPLDVPKSNGDAWKRRVKDRWLLHAGSITRGRLVRHGIARLWWVAHLTYEPHAFDGIAKGKPYAYTREVFKSEDRLNAIFDREVGAFPLVRHAVLDHAASLGTKATDKYLHRIMQYLTLVHGYRDVGVLDVVGVKNLINYATKHAGLGS
ncbi:DUF6339 family protein [Marinobacter sp. BGYM27]|uniref:DUF6339 family protein n=1 Tax=Marinobacter sp. BGYM27 TaxID=2975597 RepID=UPI0021A50CBA|nr:DUF6339 family protein [Marinobacter sp. BGYM27]MDG5499175.1 DUF6339 family protein [Marinobacter sp. BGYM27]